MHSVHSASSVGSRSSGGSVFRRKNNKRTRRVLPKLEHASQTSDAALSEHAEAERQANLEARHLINVEARRQADLVARRRALGVLDAPAAPPLMWPLVGDLRSFMQSGVNAHLYAPSGVPAVARATPLNLAPVAAPAAPPKVAPAAARATPHKKAPAAPRAPPTNIARRAPESDASDARGRASCLLYTSPSPRDKRQSRMPSSA